MSKGKYRLLYFVAMIVSILCILVPMAAAYFALQYFLKTGRINYLILIPGIAFPAIFWAPMQRLHEKCVEELEYDENGMSVKSNSYLKLTRKEREALDKQKLADMERILSSSVIRKMTHEGSKNPEKDMDKLIGLDEVKESMLQMASRMEFEKSNRIKTEFSTKHMVFAGAPGTGKTTVARIMTGFLYRYGYIKKNQCVEIDGNFLMADNPGDTSVKTEYIIQKATGGVLFIDEAYAMNHGGQEAIATLIKDMEDKKDKFILILAGYLDEMKRLIETNPGFKSRIREYVYFPDYNDQELGQIFNQMANDLGFAVDHPGMENFTVRMQAERAGRYFGNARTVRNVLDECINRHSLNLKQGVIGKAQKFTITGPDVSAAVKKEFFDY